MATEVTQKKNSDLQVIRHYVQTYNLPVFPINSTSKAPLTEHGFKDASKDKNTILRWAKQYPDCGWAIPTGEISGILTVDIDKHREGYLSWKELSFDDLDEINTPKVKTQHGGTHLHFLYPEGDDIRNSNDKIADGIDIRGNGGYVVVPPTPGYEWETEITTGFAEVPDWIMEILVGEKAEITESKIKVPDVIREGNRNDTLFRLACSLQAQGFSDVAVLDAIVAENKQKGDPPLDDDEITSLIEGALKYEKPNVRFEKTDLGNAERFAIKNYDIAKYSKEMNKGGTWLIWNGKYWERDLIDKVRELASSVVKSILEDAAYEDDNEYRKELAKWAINSQSEYRIRAMISLAQSAISDLKIRPNELDKDLWLLNCQNGIVNLKTGEITPHSPDQMMSKITIGNYVPNKTHPLWEKVLDDWTGGNEELRGFLKRMAGYSLIGENLDEKFFLILGDTNTGKSTFTSSFAHAIGDYAMVSDAKTFLESDGDKWSTGQTPRPDIVRLMGARLVLAGENDRDAKLNEAMVKNTTGRDMIAVRDLYSGVIEFQPAFKPWFFTNHAPGMSADDDAIWRRVVRVPFEVVVPEAKRDPHIKSQLQNDPECIDAILSWAIDGCIKYQEKGLNIPDIVLNKTQELRDTMDILGNFIKEMTENEGYISSSILYENYKSWCEDNGEIYASVKEFTKLMENKKYQRKRRTSGYFYLQIRLR